MNVQLFLSKFLNIVTGSTDFTELRKLIVRLSIKGKIVDSFKEDEKAASLVENTYKRVDKFEIELPLHWKIVSLGDVIQLISGQHLKPQEQNREGRGIPYVTGASDFGVLYPIITRWTEEAKSVADKGDILISVKGTIGKLNLVKEEPIALGRQVMAIRPLQLYPKYIYWVLFDRSSYFRGKSIGIAIPGISREDILSLEMGVPPIAEQKRIVAKLEELMALCDHLEEQRSQLEEIRQKSIKELLDRIIRALTNDKLLENWQILHSHFSNLFVTSEAISSLKQAIVQLGIEGKLGTQVDAEESAQDLLIKLEREYVEKLRAKNADKRISIKAISEGEIRFTYPSYWQIVRFGQLVLSSESGWSPQCDEIPRNKDSEWGILKVSAVTWDKFLPHENKALPKDEKPRPSIEVRDDDFLISRANTPELVAKSVVVINTPPKLMMSDKIIRLNFSSFVDKRFYNLFNNSKLGRNYYENHATGTSSSMRNVSRQLILNMPVPLPPLNEQRLIVIKVEKLLTLCEYLNEALKEFNFIREQLLIALLESVLYDESVGKITGLKKEPNRATKNLTVSIEINLSMGKDISNTKLAKILGINDGRMEAKELWKASALKNIDEFYALLKQEIEDGFIQEPDVAELKLVETDE
ncbi:MAG: restriction endonuclease subunit S [Nostoc sp.]|uniref:restriction endonuclease subunit S n=1 Tax=Nostoc sp. TaxID=1180 RepID=UPI002FF957E9